MVESGEGAADDRDQPPYYKEEMQMKKVIPMDLIHAAATAIFILTSAVLVREKLRIGGKNPQPESVSAAFLLHGWARMDRKVQKLEPFDGLACLFHCNQAACVL